jgi:hypothetical protein
VRPELKAIQETFERAGWKAIPLRGSEALQTAFKSSYATAGILITDSVGQVLDTWETAQETLRELRSSDPNLRDNDAYLVIVVPRVDMGADSLREVLNNTYVCRKVCVEVDGRTIEEALKELPFFAAATTEDGSTMKAESGTSSEDLPELPLEDLRKASAEVILEGLLQEKYRRGGA